MAKNIADFKFLGNEGNLFSFDSWKTLIFGVFATLTAFALGQTLFQKAGTIIPKFDSSIEPVMTQPQAKNSNAKRYVR